MTRFYLRFSLVLLVFLVVQTFLAHALPYDDREVRDLLTSSGCRLPCFMGITPGETSAEDAVRILQRSAWVESITVVHANPNQIDLIQWRWSGKQPDYIDGRVSGILHVLGAVDPAQDPATIGHTVMSIWFQTVIPYGSLYLALGGGSSDEHYYRKSPKYALAKIFTIYPDYDLTVSSPIIQCPMTVSRYWHTPVIFETGYAVSDLVAYICSGI